MEHPDSVLDLEQENGRIPIVAIGASAGGLEPLRQLLGEVPPTTGMAFVVIQHLDPERPSQLSAVLSKDVRLPVVEATHGMRAEANRVHVIPSDADLSIKGGILQLETRQPGRKLHLPIDAFFRSLAADQAGKAIGVVLSGSASDGTDGLRVLKAAGGITFAQTPDTAQFRSMPESAIAAGVVDFRLSPEAIGMELARLSHHPYLTPREPEMGIDEPLAADERNQVRIISALRQHAALDFRGYKRPTIMRRVARRMALRRFGSLSDYAEALREDATEAKALAQDILIHVTSFFRDSTAFDTLKEQVLPEIVRNKSDDATVRIWVPGCATGEEAYSIAICLHEVLMTQGRELGVKIFGSDLSERAIETARTALYSESDLEGVSTERLNRFFERADGMYRIGRRVRDVCVFVQHDLARDPPFAKLDLISCRNVLIYFDNELQRRIVPLLHHCLGKPGYLFLGRSEAISGFGDLFVPSNKKHRIFLKTGESPRIDYPLSLGRDTESKLPAYRPLERPQPTRDAQRQADHILLNRYAPPGVVVNERFEIIQFRGHTREFLEQPPGQPQMNVLKMAREGLVAHLREALETARTQAVTVNKRDIRLNDDNENHVTDLEVVPLARVTETAERFFLIVFETRLLAPPPVTEAPVAPPPRAPVNDEITRLKAELNATRDYLQALTGEHQDATEELAAANDELVAANEELQSTNEELQSAKEELQSTNEELTTVNDELRNRNQQLDVVANDLINLIESVQIPVIMVDHALKIRRLTPTAREISSLLPGDVGRSIDDVKLKVKVDDLADRIRETIETITPREWDVQGLDGRWFRLHIRPYRTEDNRLDGAVLSFIDVDVLKRAVEAAEHARDFAQRIVETVPTPLVVLDGELRVISSNPAFYRGFATSPDRTEGSSLFELAGGAWDRHELRQALSASLNARSPFRNLEIECEFPAEDQRTLLLAGCPIRGGEGEPMLLLAAEDITERRTLEASEKQARVEAEQANRSKDLFLATLSHELRTPLSAILVGAQILERTAPENPASQRASATIQRAVRNQARLIDDLLDISRIVAGKLMLDLQTVDLSAVVEAAVDFARPAAENKRVAIELSIDGPMRPVHGDPVRLQQVVSNLLSNATKFTPAGGKITVQMSAEAEQARIRVTDTGIGIRTALLPQIFGRFVQAESAMTRAHGGLGLGLAIARHLVYVHGGTIEAESPGEGKGSTFAVTLPFAEHDVLPAVLVPRESSRSIAGIKVLLVEDDEDTRDACAIMLEAQGALVRAVPSAAEGHAAIEEFKPQVILCDVAMPSEDGYTFMRKLRQQPETSGGQTPSAALTALVGEADRRRAMDAGFDLHLAKPIDTARLVAAVAELSAWTRASGQTLNLPSPPR